MSKESEDKRRERNRLNRERERRRKEEDRKKREAKKHGSIAKISGNGKEISNSKTSNQQTDKKREDDKDGSVRHKGLSGSLPRIIALIGIAATVLVSMAGNFHNLLLNCIAGWIALNCISIEAFLEIRNHFSKAGSRTIIRLTFIGLACLITGFAVFGYRWMSIDPNLLTPGDEPMPIRYTSGASDEYLKVLPPEEAMREIVKSNQPIDDWKETPKGAMRIYLGNAMTWTKSFPYFVFTQGHDDLMFLEREDSGGVLFTGKFFDANGRVACWIDKNVDQQIRPERWVVKKFADRIEVFNDETKMFANVEYLNPNAIRITGDFFLENGLHIVLNDDEQRYGDHLIAHGGVLRAVGGKHPMAILADPPEKPLGPACFVVKSPGFHKQ